MRKAVVMAMLAAAAVPTAAWGGGCTLSSTGLAFGAYQPLTFAGKVQSVDRTSDALLSVSCTGIAAGGSYSIALGPSPGGKTQPRYLANPRGGPDMAFNVYREPSLMTVWGDGATGALLTGNIPVGNSLQQHNVYGKIPAGQNQLRVGSFGATLTMTVTYNP